MVFWAWDSRFDSDSVELLVLILYIHFQNWWWIPIFSDKSHRKKSCLYLYILIYTNIYLNNISMILYPWNFPMQWSVSLCFFLKSPFSGGHCGHHTNLRPQKALHAFTQRCQDCLMHRKAHVLRCGYSRLREISEVVLIYQHRWAVWMNYHLAMTSSSPWKIHPFYSER